MSKRKMTHVDSSFRKILWWSQLASLGLIIVELCWMVPWFRLILEVSVVPTPLLASIVLCGMMVGGYLLALLLETGRFVRSVQIVSQLVLLIIGVLLGTQILLNGQVITTVNNLVSLDPGAVLVTISLIWMWWRGVTLGKEPIRPLTAWRRFELGLIMLIAFQLIVGRLTINRSAIGLFVLYLFIGLLTIVLTRISYVGLTQHVIGNPFDRRWFLTTISLLGVIIGLAALLGGFLTGQFSILELLDTGVRFAIAIFIFIVSLPGLLFSNLLAPLAPWLRQVLNGSTNEAGQPGDSVYPLPLSATITEPQMIPLWLQALIFWLVVIGIIVLIVIRTRRGIQSKQIFMDEQPESLLKQGEARRLFKKALNDVANDLSSRFRPAQRVLDIARIRYIYSQLLGLCAELGHPRRVGQTPSEFLPEMGEIFSDRIIDLGRITSAYLLVRYGELPEQITEMDEIEAAWMRILEEGKRLKKIGYSALKTAEVKEIERFGV